jgi:hypothetical protein
MIAIQKAGELPKTMFPTGRRATIQPVLTAVAVVFLILPSHAAVADTGWQNLDGVSAVKVLPQGVEVEAGAVRDRVTALSSNLVCVRYAPRGVFPAEQSFAVLPRTNTTSVWETKPARSIAETWPHLLEY